MPNIMRINDLGFAPNYSPTYPQILNGIDSVRVEGSPVAIVGSVYQNHKKGDNKHNLKIASTGSGSVRAKGIPIHREGDSMSCNHVAQAGAKRTRAGG
jgi:uncharacterized Zn-binding protein involved in type VI secretion